MGGSVMTRRPKYPPRCGSLRPIGEVASNLCRQRAAEHLHGLGPRPVLEALVEVEAGTDLDSVLADFAQLDRETVRQLGGDQFPAAPLREVEP